MEEKTRILIVDDEEDICELLELHFQRHGFDVFTAASGKQAISLVKANNPHVVLLDKKMPEMDGIQTLEAIRQFNQGVKVIIVSADALDSNLESCIKDLNAAGYLRKPLNIVELDAMVAKVIK